MYNLARTFISSRVHRTRVKGEGNDAECDRPGHDRLHDGRRNIHPSSGFYRHILKEHLLVHSWTRNRDGDAFLLGSRCHVVTPFPVKENLQKVGKLVRRLATNNI